MAGPLGPDPKAHRRWQEKTGRAQQSQHRANGPDLHRQARRLGLEVVSAEDDDTMHLQGTLLAGVRVDLYRGPPEGPESEARRWPWRLEARAPGLPPGLLLQAAGALDRGLLGRLGGGQHVGEASFDEVVKVHGPRPELLAILSAPVRKQIAWLCARGGEVREGVMRRSLKERRMPRRILAHARSMAVITSRMAQSGKRLDEALLRNAVHDPAPGFRAQVLALLVERDGGAYAPALLQALAAAAHSDEPALQSQGSEGLNGAFGAGRVRLEDCDEMMLLALLRAQPAEIRGQIIARLHDIGTQRSVPPLVALEQAFFKGRAHRQAARAAVEAILARTGELKAGGLTVVEAQGPGKLSLIPSPEGGLGVELED